MISIDCTLIVLNPELCNDVRLVDCMIDDSDKSTSQLVRWPSSNLIREIRVFFVLKSQNSDEKL